MSTRPAFSAFGLEIEYMIVDRHTLSIAPIAPQFLEEIKATAATHFNGTLCWSNELACHAVELKNAEPAKRISDLRAAMQCEIGRANRVLAAHGAMLMPGGAHPWMNPRIETRLWSGPHAEIYAAYHRIFNCFDHGWSNLQSLQLNLPFADDEEFARLHAASRLIAPIIPALAASSPVIEGHFAGVKDARMQAYCTHQARAIETQGQVIPENARSASDFETKVINPMYRAIAPLDPEGVLQREWLNVRVVAPRFSRHAIELRNIDTQECAKADLAVAQAVTLAIKGLFDTGNNALASQQAISTEALVQIHQACIRDGSHALILDPDYLHLMNAPTLGIDALTLWKHLLMRATEGAVDLDEATRSALCMLISHGPLSRRLLRAINNDFSHEHLATIWRQLCHCLQEDKMFLPKSLQ